MDTDSAAPDERLLLAVEEARRGIDQQKDDLTSLRERAGTLIATAGLAATFIGGIAVAATKGDDGTDISGWTVGAGLAFLAVATTALVVLHPRTWHFDMNPTGVIGWIDNQGASLDDIRRNLAEQLWANYGANEERFNFLMRCYSWGVCFLVAEIALLLIDLKGR